MHTCFIKTCFCLLHEQYCYSLIDVVSIIVIDIMKILHAK